MKFRLGTRASALAQWQANWVRAQLEASGHAVELVLISTMGDATQTAATSAEQSVAALGTVGVFTKELQRALLDDRIDLAVHSLKDLPTDEIPGLTLAAVPPRESVADVLISRHATRWGDLPTGSRLGTGSLRRRAQLLHVRPDLTMCDIRGNVDTRLKKLQAGDFDAIVLAEAGLRRLGLLNEGYEKFSFETMLPAVGQGALGIETRQDDHRTQAALAALNDPVTQAAVLAERALLAALSGGCLAPIAAWCRPAEQQGWLQLDAVVLSPDGSQRLAASRSQPVEDSPIEFGQQVAAELQAAGAEKLIAQSRR